MASQSSLNTGRQDRGLKRSAEDETVPTAMRVVSAVGSDLIMLFRDTSVSATRTAPSAKRIARVESDDTSDCEETSSPSTPIDDSDPTVACKDASDSLSRPRRPAKRAVDSHAKRTFYLSKTSPEMFLFSATPPESPAERSAAASNSDAKPKLLDMSLASKPSKGVKLMDLPSELRLNILSHALGGAAGPSGSLSVNPRAKILSDPSGEYHDRAETEEEQRRQTKWQARRGMLQTCHVFREEALEVLYRENPFFARMSQYGTGKSHWTEKARFENWLKSVGGDEEIQRVKKVTFGVQWPARVEEGLGWSDRLVKGDLCVSIFKGKATVVGSSRIAECPAEPLERVDALIKEMMVGEGLGYDGWMAVWDTVESIMMSGWDVRPKKKNV